jgi:hypothetical protein
MPTITRPPKQAVRDYLAARRNSRQPPPAPAEIRRQLGWGMLHPKSIDTTR